MSPLVKTSIIITLAMMLVVITCEIICAILKMRAQKRDYVTDPPIHMKSYTPCIKGVYLTMYEVHDEHSLPNPALGPYAFKQCIFGDNLRFHLASEYPDSTMVDCLWKK